MAGGCILDCWSWPRTNGVELLGDALAVAVVWCCGRSAIGIGAIIFLLPRHTCRVSSVCPWSVLNGRRI